MAWQLTFDAQPTPDEVKEIEGLLAQLRQPLQPPTPWNKTPAGCTSRCNDPECEILNGRVLDTPPRSTRPGKDGLYRCRVCQRRRRLASKRRGPRSDGDG